MLLASIDTTLANDKERKNCISQMSQSISKIIKSSPSLNILIFHCLDCGIFLSEYYFLLLFYQFADNEQEIRNMKIRKANDIKQFQIRSSKMLFVIKSITQK